MLARLAAPLHVAFPGTPPAAGLPEDLQPCRTLGSATISADAVMCIDAIQFSDPPLAALRQCRRILASRGRLAVTAWEPCGPVPEAVPDRLRHMNLARHLLEAGFEQIEVTEKPDWYAAERTLWEAALQAGTSGDPALASLQQEATQALAAFDIKRRVLATATAPAHAA